MGPDKRIIRSPAVAGMFYPGEPTVLRREVRSMLEHAGTPSPRGTILGVLSPHAGYMFSGPTAAAAYSHLVGISVDTVVVVSPSHREVFDGVSAYAGDAYATPLGVIPVNTELRARLVKKSAIVTASERGHRQEHAIEVQLPFLQEILASFTVLPLVIGNQSPPVCFALGDALGSVLQGVRCVLVASTDLSHYHPAQIADRLDSVFLDDVRRFDEERLMRDLEEGRTEACGGGPAVAVLRAMRILGASTVEVVHHCNSGDVTGDRDSVVGYVSAVGYA